MKTATLGLVVGRAMRLVVVDGDTLALTERFTLQRNLGLEYGVWIFVGATPFVLHVNEICETLIWTESEGVMTVLYPYPLRTSGLIR